jgi:peptidoglycan/LPS O-acetylase OafA/YrhL
MRAVAAGMVFFYHWLFTVPNQWDLIPRALVREGYLGVTVFFALSGFLITTRYFNDLRERKISYGSYLIKRFARIYPLYFFVMTFMVVALGRPIGQPPADAWSAIVNYTLTQALFPSLLLSGTATAWTLTIEEAFYLLAPVLMKCLMPVEPHTASPSLLWRLLMRTSLVISLAFGIAIALSFIPPILSNTLLGAKVTYLLQYSPFGRLPDLIIGMLLGVIYVNRERLPRLHGYSWLLIWVGVVGTGIGIVLTNVIGGEIGSYANRAVTFMVAITCGISVLGMALDSSNRNLITRVLGSRPLVYLGKLSYGLYLIQLTEPCQWVYWILLGSIEDRVIRAVLLYGAATLMCAVLYALIEHPAQRAITRLAPTIRLGRMFARAK